MFTLWDVLREALKKRTKHWGDSYGSMDSENTIFKLDLLAASIKNLSQLCLICMALGVTTLMAIHLSLVETIKYNSTVLPERVIGVLENEAAVLSYVASCIIFYSLFLFLWLIIGGLLLRDIGKKVRNK